MSAVELLRQVEVLPARERERFLLAVLKLGKRWAMVRPLLERRGLLEGALFARRVGWPDQVVAPAAALAAGEMPYFSLLLLRQGWPAVLPWS